MGTSPLAERREAKAQADPHQYFQSSFPRRRGRTSATSREKKDRQEAYRSNTGRCRRATKRRSRAAAYWQPPFDRQTPASSEETTARRNKAQNRNGQTSGEIRIQTQSRSNSGHPVEERRFFKPGRAPQPRCDPISRTSHRLPNRCVSWFIRLQNACAVKVVKIKNADRRLRIGRRACNAGGRSIPSIMTAMRKSSHYGCSSISVFVLQSGRFELVGIVQASKPM